MLLYSGCSIRCCCILACWPCVWGTKGQHRDPCLRPADNRPCIHYSWSPMRDGRGAEQRPPSQPGWSCPSAMHQNAQKKDCAGCSAAPTRSASVKPSCAMTKLMEDVGGRLPRHFRPPLLLHLHTAKRRTLGARCMPQAMRKLHAQSYAHAACPQLCARCMPKAMSTLHAPPRCTTVAPLGQCRHMRRASNTWRPHTPAASTH